MKTGIHPKLTQTLYYNSLNNGLYISHSFIRAKILHPNFISLNQTLINDYKMKKKKKLYKLIFTTHLMLLTYELFKFC